MILIYNKETNIIERILSCTEEQAKTFCTSEQDYTVFTHTGAYTGMDMRAVNEDGSIMSNAEQIENGYLALLEDEKIDENDNIVKLSEDELKEKFPERYPTPSTEELQTQELEQVEQEIQSMEMNAGMEIVRELGRQKLSGESNA